MAVAGRRGVHAVVRGEGVGSVEPPGALLQGFTLGAGLVLVPRSGVVNVDLAAGVVLELEFVGDVVEDDLVGAEVRVGVAHVVPFNDEHLVGVANFEGCRRRLDVVGAGHIGRNVFGGDVVRNVVRGVQVSNLSGPVANRHNTLCARLTNRRHGRRGRGAVVDAVVEGRARTSRGADVQTGRRGTRVANRRRHGARASVGISKFGVGDRRSVGVGLGCDLHHVVGDGAAGSHATVVAGSESESVPLVVRVVGVVVARGTTWGTG